MQFRKFSDPIVVRLTLSHVHFVLRTLCRLDVGPLVSTDTVNAPNLSACHVCIGLNFRHVVMRWRIQ